MKRYTPYIILLSFIFIGLCGCASRKKNTAQTRMYHSFFARYNTYYNGNTAYKDAKKAQIEGHKDNYLELLPLLITSDEKTQKTGIANYAKAIEKSQKAIKNHSIKRKPRRKAGTKLSEKQKKFYAQKEFNPFLWKAWMMMANAQFAKGDFTEAASTYMYITRLYEGNPKIVAEARIRLAQCYSEMDWLYEAEDLLSRVRRDSLPESLEDEMALANANLLLRQKRYSDAIPHIEKAVRRKNTVAVERAREYYLLGQLYNKTGNSTAAFKNFAKAIKQNPPYELEINARIRQTETRTNEDPKKIIRSLERMLKSPKNKNHISQLYYAIGNLHLSSHDTLKAVRAYETGLVEGESSGYGKNMLHFSLAKLYWELEKFSKAAPNYQSAIPNLNEEQEDFGKHKLRNDFLGELSPHTDIVEKNSELLLWASLDENTLFSLIDKKIEQAEFEQELQEKSEEKTEQVTSAGSDLATAGTAAGMAMPDNTTGKQLWYFYNPQLVSQGIRAFSGTWGERELKDFWRLSKVNLSSMQMQQEDSIPNDSTTFYDSATAGDTLAVDSTNITDITATDSLSTDPTTREYYLQQIPQTEEQKSELHKALANALFDAAIIFEEKLGDKHPAMSYWQRFINEYPENQRMAEAYYHMYLCCSRWKEPEQAELYRNLLITHYPDSSMSHRIQDPDFFESVAAKQHKEDSLYADAYENFKKENYNAVIEKNIYAEQKYPDGKHRARFMYIDALSKLYSNRQDEALATLESLTNKFSKEDISKIAQEISTGIKAGHLLRSGLTISIWDRKLDGTIKGDSDSIPPFIAERNEPYYFVLAYPTDSLDEKRLLFEMARYNFSRYMVRNFTMEFNKQPEVTLLQVKEFLNFDEAFIYRKRLYSNNEMAQLLEGINALVISKTNLDLLLNHYTFEDYRQFYEKNLLVIPEIEIDGYTLDEPEYDDY